MQCALRVADTGTTNCRRSTRWRTPRPLASSDAGHCKAAYEQCHKLLTERCDLIARHGGVARMLTPTDWANLSKLVASHPFDSSKLP